jgi:hypothetical protein
VKTNAEIRKAAREKASLDDVLGVLGSLEGKISVERFRAIVAEIAGEPVDALKPGRLPGCI